MIRAIDGTTDPLASRRVTSRIVTGRIVTVRIGSVGGLLISQHRSGCISLAALDLGLGDELLRVLSGSLGPGLSGDGLCLRLLGLPFRLLEVGHGLLGSFGFPTSFLLSVSGTPLGHLGLRLGQFGLGCFSLRSIDFGHLGFTHCRGVSIIGNTIALNVDRRHRPVDIHLADVDLCVTLSAVEETIRAGLVTRIRIDRLRGISRRRG